MGTGTGTDLQEIVDAVKIKIPAENLSGKTNQIIQLLKSAASRCRRRTSDDLSFHYYEEVQEGYFEKNIAPQVIELLSMYIVKDYLSWKFSALAGQKKYLGTSAFNKLPSDNGQYESLRSQIEYWSTEIEKFETAFPDCPVPAGEVTG